MEKYAKGVRGDNALDINAGKRVKSMKNTNQELKAVEEAIEEAQKTREQLLLNKQAIMASLSNKALKVVEVAHARIVLQKATALVKMSSKESTPENSPPSSPSAPIDAEEDKDDAITAAGGGVIGSAKRAITSYFGGSSSSSDQANKKAKNS
jgi:predicted transcriptional regulator